MKNVLITALTTIVLLASTGVQAKSTVSAATVQNSSTSTGSKTEKPPCRTCSIWKGIKIK